MIKATKPTRVQYRRADAVNYYLQEINAGRLRISDVRKQMTQEQIDNDEITMVVKMVDDKLQKQAVVQFNRNKGKSYIVVGAILIGLSLLSIFFIEMFPSKAYFVISLLMAMGAVTIAKGRLLLNSNALRR